ncbi:MAG TPA: DUF1361 domain-containing protein [Bacteroidia bacterium]|nr:DUF1361 domain-containing protein [Bacteroidia bacterium]
MKNFIYFLASTNRLKIAIWLCISIIGGFVLLSARIQVTGLFYFRFLIWNMFLAFIPYAVSTLLAYYSQTRKSVLVIVPAMALWMLFFPNAPYIITDLFHLRQRPQIPLWFDLLLILTFAWNGLILAYTSLADMQEIVTRLFNRFAGWIFVIGSLCLSGFWCVPGPLPKVGQLEHSKQT